MNQFHEDQPIESADSLNTVDLDSKSDWPVPEEDQKALVSFLSDELDMATRNNAKVIEDFEEYYNMIHAVRVSKPNEWESDIYLPEYLSRLQTQIGNFVAQYFGSTDFVEVDINSDDPKDILEARASKKLLNKLLNDKRAYYYHKIVRMLMFCFSCGYGIIKGGYKQNVRTVVSHYNQKSELATHPETGEYLAEDGMPYMNPMMQRPKYNTVQEPVYKNDIIDDRPVFDVYPVQNVYMSPEYCYSLNDKQYVIFETEKTLDGLRDEQEEMEYFNLDVLDKSDPAGSLGVNTYNKDGDKEEHPAPVSKTFVIYERWGQFPYIEDEQGNVSPGMDKDGQRLPGAVLGECIITSAKQRATEKLETIIRFKKSPHTKRPMVRFLCYVDMVNDCGFGDGEANRELQRAINDNYNLMNFRTRMAITPAFKGKKFAGLPDRIQLSPDKVVMIDGNVDSDLKEIQIQDNIQGGVVHQNLLSGRMDYCMATAPQTMGASPERGETATAASIINQRANIRIGMKSMNLEFIGFTEFYDMLLTLCNDFMLPETLEDLIGEDAYNYNPGRDDKFKPVSQALESEESKQFKVKTLQSMLPVIAPIQNPKTAMTINMIVGEIFETLGKNFKHIKKFLLEDDPSVIAIYQAYTGASGGQGTPPAMDPMAPASNQTGIPQSNMQQQVRQNAPRQTMAM